MQKDLGRDQAAGGLTIMLRVDESELETKGQGNNDLVLPLFDKGTGRRRTQDEYHSTIESLSDEQDR